MPLWDELQQPCRGSRRGLDTCRVSFGPFSFSERGDFIGSKLPVCLESWLCRESFRGWETRPLAQVTWTASDFENDTSKLVQICANSCRLRRKQMLNLIDRLSMSSFMSYSDNVWSVRLKAKTAFISHFSQSHWQRQSRTCNRSRTKSLWEPFYFYLFFRSFNITRP